MKAMFALGSSTTGPGLFLFVLNAKLDKKKAGKDQKLSTFVPKKSTVNLKPKEVLYMKSKKWRAKAKSPGDLPPKIRH
jgi:hypothetical protein